jgi:hypothetical protein
MKIFRLFRKKKSLLLRLYIECVKDLEKENEQLKRKIGVMQSCHFNSCIGCNDKKCEVKK